MVYIRKHTEEAAYLSPSRKAHPDEEVERLDGSQSNSNSRPRAKAQAPHMVEDHYRSKEEGSYFSGDFM